MSRESRPNLARLGEGGRSGDNCSSYFLCLQSLGSESKGEVKVELGRGAGGSRRFVRQGGGRRVSRESASWHRRSHLYIFLLLCIFLFFLFTLLNNADLPHPVEVSLDAWHPGWLRRGRLLGYLGDLIGRQEGIKSCSRQTFSRADIQVLSWLLPSLPLPISLCFSCSVMPLSPKFSLCQEEVGGGHMVVLIPIETVYDGLSGGYAAGHHLLDDVCMVLL